MFTHKARSKRHPEPISLGIAQIVAEISLKAETPLVLPKYHARAYLE